MWPSCVRYQRENLSALPESQLNMSFQTPVIAAMLLEGMTAFFEGRVVKSGWGLGVPWSC